MTFLFFFISRFSSLVSPLRFPIVVPRCITPGGCVQVLEPDLAELSPPHCFHYFFIVVAGP
jgi:hypothetical protein